MSEGIRGRVLIVSNAYSSSPRPGSEQDFNNLKIMFERFHFDVVGEHKDYTAKVRRYLSNPKHRCEGKINISGRGLFLKHL